MYSFTPEARLRILGPAIAAAATLVLVLAAPANASATSAPTGLQHARPELSAVVGELVAAGAPGAAVRERHGQEVRTAAAGRAERRTGSPMNVHLRYRAGSLTKPMVATVVLQVVGEGKLALTDTVEHWLPGLLPYGDQVTLRQLLTMTSGIPEYLHGRVAVDSFGPLPARLRSWTPRELVSTIADLPPRFAPGTSFEYSNTNYVLAGMIVEAATGSSLGREMSRRVFRPLRLTDTSFPVHKPTIPGRNAHGYSLRIDPERGPVEGAPLRDVTLLDPSFAWAAGNVVSDLDDLTRFLGALLGGHLLPPSLLAEMTRQVDTGDPEASYGMGLEFIHTPCGTVVGHSGSIPGFQNIVLATVDGRNQVGLVVNQYLVGRASAQAFSRGAVTLMRRLFPDGSCTVAATAAARSIRMT